MKNITLIISVFMIYSCNSSSNNENIVSKDEVVFNFDSLNTEIIKNHKTIIENLEDKEKFEYLFINPLIDDTIMHLYYENSIPVDYTEPYNKLIFARKNNSDGKVTLYAHTPPNHTLKTYIFSKNLKTLEAVNDTIYGEIIEFILTKDLEVEIICFGLNSKNIAIFKDSYLLYYNENPFKGVYPLLISENYNKRNKRIEGYKEGMVIIKD